MTDATSPYLNQPLRNLADVVQLRESSDLGIPSDCDPHGTAMGDHSEVPYMLRAHPIAYPSSRYGNRTIHDAMASEEMSLTHCQQEQDARYRRRAWAVIGMGLIAFWGFVFWQVI